MLARWMGAQESRSYRIATPRSWSFRHGHFGARRARVSARVSCVRCRVHARRLTCRSRPGEQMHGQCAAGARVCAEGPPSAGRTSATHRRVSPGAASSVWNRTECRKSVARGPRGNAPRRIRGAPRRESRPLRDQHLPPPSSLSIGSSRVRNPPHAVLEPTELDPLQLAHGLFVEVEFLAGVLVTLHDRAPIRCVSFNDSLPGVAGSSSGDPAAARSPSRYQQSASGILARNP
jgi:hypothetical protein